MDDASGIDSLTTVFKSAMWAEREAWDMFGVFFIGHPDLRRMLTDYGFEGHPLRKDFPLGGYTEVYWDAANNIIKYASPPVFREEYRDYENIETEWEDLYHRCNTAWAYDRMVNKGMESCDKDFTFDDAAVHKKQKQVCACSTQHREMLVIAFFRVLAWSTKFLCDDDSTHT